MLLQGIPVVTADTKTAFLIKVMMPPFKLGNRPSVLLCPWHSPLKTVGCCVIGFPSPSVLVAVILNYVLCLLLFLKSFFLFLSTQIELSKDAVG